MNIDWEAKEYASKFNFVPQYGKGVIELITAPVGSRVLDLVRRRSGAEKTSPN